MEQYSDVEKIINIIKNRATDSNDTMLMADLISPKLFPKGSILRYFDNAGKHEECIELLNEAVEFAKEKNSPFFIENYVYGNMVDLTSRECPLSDKMINLLKQHNFLQRNIRE